MASRREKALEAALKYATRGQHDKAAREYQVVVDEDPKDIRSWLLLADCLVRSGQREKAISRYIQVGKFYSEDKQYEKALAVYRQVLNLDSERMDVRLKCAQLYRGLNQIPEAVAAYETVAQACLRRDNVKDAVSLYATVVELEPTVIAKRLRLAELYSRENQIDEAVAAFTTCSEQLLAAGQRDQYIRVAERLLFHRETVDTVVRQLVRVYLDTDQPRRSLVKLNGLLQRNSTDPDGLELLAETFVALGKRDKALSVIMELVRDQKSHGDKGRDRAIRALQNAMRWLPERPELRDMMAQLDDGETHVDVIIEPSEGVSETIELEPEAVELIESGIIVEEVDAEDLEDIEEFDEIESFVAEEEDESTGAIQLDVDSSIWDVGELESNNRQNEDGGSTIHNVELDKHLSEARVLVKYRLFDHAETHLNLIFERWRDHVDAREVQAELLEERGKGDEAAQLRIRLAQALANSDPTRAIRLVDAALERIPQHAQALALKKQLQSRSDSKTSSEKGVPDEVLDERDSVQPNDSGVFSFEVAVDGKNSLDGVYDEEPEQGDADDFSISIQTENENESSLKPEQTREESRFDLPDEPEPSPEFKPTPEPVPKAATSSKESQEELIDDLADEISEIEFYWAQELVDDAKIAYGDLLRRYPGHPKLIAVAERFPELSSEIALEVDSSATPGGGEPFGGIKDDEDEEYLSSIFASESSSSPSSAAPKKSSASIGAVSDLQDDDPAARFDLATAYREMGLVDAALAEFEICSRDAQWCSRALVMMADLHMFRGEVDTALSSLKQAVEVARSADERSQANYQLGMVHMQLGESEEANHYFQAVDRGFRDVEEKLAELNANQ